MPKAVLWTVIAATLAVYAVMVVWSLPRVAAEAGGVIPFDLRPLGYGADEARAFLAALSPEGRDFYAGVQHRLDLAYPALLALSLILCLARLVPSRGLWLVLSAVALAGMGADYAENFLVGQMLALPPAEVPGDLVGRASLATVVKSAASGLAMSALLLALGWRVWRRWV